MRRRSRIRVGLIGCGGYMRHYHVPELLANRWVELAALADTDAGQIEALFAQTGMRVPGYADYRDMIRRERLDAVVISTPHALHYEQVRFALSKGLHVLVEKPLTIRADHAEKLVALAEKKERFLMVAYQRFHQREFVYARELIAGGKIGEVRGVAGYITQDWSGNSGWRIDPALSGGGFMRDTGSHLVSATLRVTGLKPGTVRAVIQRNGFPVDLMSVLSITFSNGALGSLSFYGQAKWHDECLSIHGSGGCIVLRSHRKKPQPLLVNGEPVEIPKRINPASPDATFIGWIRSGGRGYAPLLDAVETVRLTEAAYRSAGRTPNHSSVPTE